MELRLIYGTAGTGKTEKCFEETAKLIKENKNIIIITPEQFSYTAEKKLMEKIDTNAVLNAEVVTFNRMAYRVINELGKQDEIGLSKSGKAMLIYSILENQKKNLKFLGKTSENVDLVINAINEFKQHGIMIEQLKEQIENTQDKYLQTKLKDLHIMYNEFEEAIQGKYIEETDLLNLLAENVDKTNLFNDTIFYIDEFSGFTAQEYEVIKKLITISKSVNITICTDSLITGTNPENDIFYSNKETVKKILEIADELKIETIQTNLEKTYRFKNSELEYLEKNLYKNVKEKYNENIKNIHLFLAKNQYSEIEQIARKITKLVRNENYMYKDISIITKNIDTYSSLVRAIFSKYQIPVFIDEKRELSQNILIQYVLSILEIYAKNWSYEAVFNYIKSGFTDHDEEEIFKLEKYCIKWGIKNNKWKQDFKVYGEDKQKEEINRLNEIRKEIIEPLIDLKESIDKEKTVYNITNRIYKFMQEQEIEQKLSEKIRTLEEKGKIDLANEYNNSYKVLIDLLDEIVMIFKNEKCTLDKYLKILKIGLQNSGLGKIPGTQDEVILGDVDRSRSHKVKAIFIIGINDGIFPAINKDEGFLNDNDRIYLKERGIELAKGTLERLYEDNFNIYKAFTIAENKLYLSYTSSDSEGKAQRPSVIITKLKKIFPKIYEESDVIEENQEISMIQASYEELIKNIAKFKENETIEEEWIEVYNYFKNHENWNKRLQKDLKGIDYTNIPENLDKEVVKKIHGDILKTSISQLEKYRSCPFSYYLQYELKIKEKEELKVQSFDTGTFMHDIIDDFFKSARQQNIELVNFLENPEMVQTLVENLIEEKLNNGKEYMFKETVKYRILVRRLKNIITMSLKYIIESLVYSDFDIFGTEIEFGKKEEYKPIIIKLDDGRRVELTGKIDRMDIAQNEDGRYVRIIDYKSSAKNIDLNEVFAGLQIQLLTYLDAVSGEDTEPAGVLYFSLLEQIVKADKKIPQEEIEEQIRKSFKMKGLILADVKVIKMQDKNLTTGSSKIIPAGITASGEVNKRFTNGVTKEEFKILQKYIYKTIKDISNEILNGKIDLKPYNKKGKTPCEYCNYKTICGFNTKMENNKYNFIEHKTNEEVVNKMKKLL